MNGVILDYQTLNPHELHMEELRSLPLQWTFHDKTSPEQLQERIQSANILLTNKVVIDRRTIEENPQIKMILILATGTNNVDLEAAKEHGIPVSNISGYSTESVAQQVFASLLSLERNLHRYRLSMEAGEWSKSPFFCHQPYPIRDLTGLKIGLIGYGTIAQRVHELANAFGMEVLISQSLIPSKKAKEGRIPLNELLSESDVVSLHCPLSEYSRNLIGKEEFEMMKDSAVLINMARGGIVDENALYHALKNKEIAGAVTDVLTTEPPPADHILLREPMHNLIVTPHIAWASVQARQILVDQAVEIVDSFLNGKLMNQVNG